MDVEQCLKAVTEHYPHLAVGKVVPIEAGWDSFVLDIELGGEEFIFRFPRRPEVKAQQAKEVALLSWLAGRLSVQIPQPIFFSNGQATEEVSFTGYPKIPGNPLSSADLSSHAMADQLGQILSELHSIPENQLTGTGLPSSSPAWWQREQLSFYVWTRANVFPQLPASWSKWAAWLWESYLSDAENFKFRPCLIHGDLGEEHILVDLELGKVTGMIDWEDARQGDPALDFTGLYLNGGKSFVNRVLSAYSTPGFHRQNLDSFWARIIFYARLIPFHYIRNGITTGNPARVQQGRQWLEAMVVQGMDRLEYSPVSNRT